VTDDESRLAAIYAAPDDDAPRAVYADALQERGDPRGEFISLQLAHARGVFTSESLSRERALRREHGDSWLGTLARCFSSPRFERGFLCGGEPGDLTQPAFEAPAWKLITTLIRPIHRLFEPPELALFDEPRVRLRCVRRVVDRELPALLEKPAARHLVELELVSLSKEVLEACKALPALRALSVPSLSESSAAMLLDSGVLERLSRLELNAFRGWEPIQRVMTALARQSGPLRVVECRLEERSELLDWRIRFERDTAPGPFTRLKGAWFPIPRARTAFAKGKTRAPMDLADDCRFVLQLASPEELRSVELDVGRKMRFPPSTVQQLVTQLEQMKQLEHVRVPWDFKAPQRATRRWAGSVHGRALDRIAEVWAALGELGVTFDSYSVDDRGTPKLGKTPLVTLKERAASGTLQSLALRQRGSADHFTFSRRRTKDGKRQFGASFSLALPQSNASLEAWFCRFLSLFPEGTVSMWLEEIELAWSDFPLEHYDPARPGWLIGLSRETGSLLAPASRASLEQRTPSLRTIATSTHLVLAVGAPRDATPEHVRDAANALLAQLDATVAPRAPAWFAPLALACLGPRAAAAGVTLSQQTPVRVAWSSPDRRQWFARLIPRGDGWSLYCVARDLLIAQEDAVDAASVERALRGGLTKLDQ
jgi:uncharacterized protein (TIGR02996 family)